MAWAAVVLLRHSCSHTPLTVCIMLCVLPLPLPCRLPGHRLTGGLEALPPSLQLLNLSANALDGRLGEPRVQCTCCALLQCD